ncbi:MAG: guanitoxin biosynthesis MATE family efflux transporter GntT [Cyanobacteria bacterium J06641_5]
MSAATPSVLRDRFLVDYFQLAAVNVISNLMVPLAGLIGVAFLGHLSDLSDLAGVALASILFSYLYHALSFLRMSTTGVVAQAIGRDDEAAALSIALRNGAIALILGVVVLACHRPLGHWGLMLLSAPADVKVAALDYFNARIWAAPVALFNFVLIGWLLGLKKGTRVLVMTATATAVHVLLDYFAIARWGWGSAGAGFSAAVSQYVVFGLGLVLSLQEIAWGQVRALLPEIVNWQAARETLLLNRDLFFRTIFTKSTFSAFTALSATLGTEVLAENALLLEVVTLAIYFIDGPCFATETFAGIAHGRGAREQLRRIVQVAAGTCLLLGLSFALAFVLFPRTLFGLLTDHQEITDAIALYTHWLVPLLVLGSLAFMLDGYFLGLAEGRALRNAVIIASLGGFAPLAIAAWHWHNVHLLWGALCAFMGVRAIVLGSQLGPSLALPESVPAILPSVEVVSPKS